MTRRVTFWDGEPAPAVRCHVIVADSRQLRKAVRVDLPARTFYLDDTGGCAWRHVTHRAGMSWTPAYLPVEREAGIGARLPDAITGPAAVLASLGTLTGYAIGAMAAELWRLSRAELLWRMRRAALRRDLDTFAEDVVA